LIRMHAEIEEPTERVSVLLELSTRKGGWHAMAAELRRALFALEALLRLHLSVEEEMLADLAEATAEQPRPTAGATRAIRAPHKAHGPSG
jgi:hypothetical protein